MEPKYIGVDTPPRRRERRASAENFKSGLFPLRALTLRSLVVSAAMPLLLVRSLGHKSTQDPQLFSKSISYMCVSARREDKGSSRFYSPVQNRPVQNRPVDS